MEFIEGKNRWGEDRCWFYDGDADPRNGGRWFDLSAAEAAARPGDGDRDAVLAWATCGDAAVECVEVVDLSDTADGLVAVERGGVTMPPRYEDLKAVLSYVGTTVDDLPDDSRERLWIVASAAQSYLGMDRDEPEVLQTERRGELASHRGAGGRRVRPGIDLDDLVRRNWLAMGERLPEETWRDTGVVVCRDWTARLDGEDRACRWAFDRHTGKLLAAEARAAEGGPWEPVEDERDLDDLRDEITCPLESKDDILARPEEFEATEVVEDFDGFGPEGPGFRP